jgi:transcriptional regulator with XRE-family HTH domain
MIPNNQVKAYRLKAGMSQTELAWRIHIACTNLSAVERGRLAPWPKLRKAVSEVLGVPEDALFPDGDKPKKEGKCQ